MLSRKRNSLLYKVFFLVLIVCFVFYEVYAIEPSSQIRHPYFWKVEKDGKTSHLLGVVHEPIPIDELRCSREIQHRLEDSDLVFVELDYRTEQSKELINIQEQQMLSTDGREFQALNKKSQEFLRERIGDQWNFYGYGLLLSNLCKYGVSRIDGLKLDEQITDAAYSKGIPLRELDDFHAKYTGFKEKLKKEGEFYNSLSNTESIFTVEVNILNNRIDRFPKECPPQWLIDAKENYKYGNYRSIADIAQANVTDLSLLFNLMKRNSEWVNHFEVAHQNHERVFLAGGLAHFVFNPFDNLVKDSTGLSIITISEPFSVVDLLRVRGYIVERMFCEK
ncbi:MAG: TraB/GumN family protein [Bdellovibrionales bacterium]|nr:TraB/GumN family protein [Bdellovibrionales bacterium]